MTRWQQLGERLISRRVELNARWTDRRSFCDDNGLGRQYRTISDIEKGRRDNYGTAILALVERAYRLQAGSIASYIAGGELLPSAAPEPPPDPAAETAREWVRENPVEAMREVMRAAMRDPDIRKELGI